MLRFRWLAAQKRDAIGIDLVEASILDATQRAAAEGSSECIVTRDGHRPAAWLMSLYNRCSLLAG